MKVALKEAEEMLAVYRARISYARDIQGSIDRRVAVIDADIAKLNREREGLIRDFDTAPDVIAEYEAKIVKQARVVDHLRRGVQPKAFRQPRERRVPSPLEKLLRLKRQMAKLQGEIDGTTPEPKEKAAGRWLKVLHDTGLKFMRDRHSKLWYYCDEAGGTVYGGFDTLTEAKKNASI